MKTPSAEFIAKEEGSERQPAELYHIWKNSTHYRYTSGDVAVIYNGETYTPATIQRRPVTYSDKLEVNTLTVQVSRVTNPMLEFLAISPVDLVWISVHKLHRDLVAEETTPIFIGQIRNISIKGAEVQVNCVGFEHFLKQVVPRYRYGPGCQHTLYDSKCGLDRTDYSTTAYLSTVADDGVTLTSPSFAEQDDDYYSLGYLVWGDYSRMVISHDKDTSTVVLRYLIPGLAAGDAVVISAGCDKTRSTCQNKFNNLVNQLGFPDIPADNPATWV